MENKKFKRGMEAGGHPFEIVFREIDKELERNQENYNKNLSEMKKKINDIYDKAIDGEIKNNFNIKNIQETWEILKKHEKEYLISALFQISDFMWDNELKTSENQKKYVCCLMLYLGIKEPQQDIELETISKFDSLNSLNCILKSIMEFLFLYDNSSKLFENKYFRDYADKFHIDESRIKQISKTIEKRYRFHGAEGFYEPFKIIASEMLNKKTTKKQEITLQVEIVIDESRIEKHGERIKSYLESQNVMKYKCSIINEEKARTQEKKDKIIRLYLMNSEEGKNLTETGKPKEVFSIYGCSIKVLADQERYILQNNEKISLDGIEDEFINFYKKFCRGKISNENVKQGIGDRDKRKEVKRQKNEILGVIEDIFGTIKDSLVDFMTPDNPDNVAANLLFGIVKLPFVAGLSAVSFIASVVVGIPMKIVDITIDNLNNSKFDSKYVNEAQIDILMVAIAKYFVKKYLETDES